jgi:conjugative transfer signal peptidase TraF
MTVGLLDRLRNTRPCIVRRIAVLAVGLLACTFQICDLFGIRINTSPSLPMGLYRTTSDTNASLVEFCPAEPFGSLAIVRGYRDRGACPDGATPLLKPVVARAGDVVELSSRGIAVDGNLLSNTAPLQMDTKGRPLVPWKFGRYTVQSGDVWVASSYNRRSFDSRYFGPVPVSSIRGHLLPLFTAW